MVRRSNIVKVLNTIGSTVKYVGCLISISLNVYFVDILQHLFIRKRS